MRTPGSSRHTDHLGRPAIQRAAGFACPRKPDTAANTTSSTALFAAPRWARTLGSCSGGLQTPAGY